MELQWWRKAWHPFYKTRRGKLRVPCDHGLINYKDTKAKCRHLKKIDPYRDFSAGVFQSLYTQEIHEQSVTLVFSTQLCKLLPSLTFFLVPLPLPLFAVWIGILCLCVRGGGMGFWATDRWTLAAKSLYRSIFLRWRHFALSSMSLIFLRMWPSLFIMCTIAVLSYFLYGTSRHAVGPCCYLGLPNYGSQI